MLRASFFLRDARLRQVALRIFRDEQMKVNDSLAPLSAVQKRKVIKKLFRALPPVDMERLTVRATALQKHMSEQDADLLAAVQGVPPKRKGPETNAYELFVKEQSYNPAILALTNPRDREIKMMEIYQSLPDKAKEVWEKRAEVANTRQPIVPAATSTTRRPTARSSSRAKAAKKVKRKAAASAKKVSQKASKRQAKANKKTLVSKAKAAKKPRPPTGYTLFVKEQMATLTNLPQTERMAEVGKRWQALTVEERTRRMTEASAADPTSVAPHKNASDEHHEKETAPVTSASPATASTQDTAPGMTPTPESLGTTSAPSDPPTVDEPKKESAQSTAMPSAPTLTPEADSPPTAPVAETMAPVKTESVPTDTSTPDTVAPSSSSSPTPAPPVAKKKKKIIVKKKSKKTSPTSTASVAPNELPSASVTPPID